MTFLTLHHLLLAVTKYNFGISKIKFHNVRVFWRIEIIIMFNISLHYLVYNYLVYKMYYTCIFLQHTMARWRVAFWITIVAQVSAFVIFVIFGSEKIQPWNDPPAEVDNWDGDEGQQQQQRPQQQETKTWVKRLM